MQPLYHFGDLTVSYAGIKDSAAICRLQYDAKEQKAGVVNADRRLPDVKKIRSEIELADNHFFLASALPFSGTGPVNRDTGRQLCGYGAYHYNSAISRNFFLTHLFGVKSPYMTGSILLGLFLNEVMEANAQAVYVRPYDEASKGWYEKRAFFEPISNDYYDRKNPKGLRLIKENFAPALENLEVFTGYNFG